MQFAKGSYLACQVSPLHLDEIRAVELCSCQMSVITLTFGVI